MNNWSGKNGCGDKNLGRNGSEMVMLTLSFFIYFKKEEQLDSKDEDQNI